MRPNNTWTEDWEIGLKPKKEAKVSRELLDIFTTFWDSADLDSKSKTTQRRYSNGLQALGGYIVEKAVDEFEDKSKSTYQMLIDEIDAGEGPLIFYDNEEWQRELDTVCRKLYKYV